MFRGAWTTQGRPPHDSPHRLPLWVECGQVFAVARQFKPSSLANPVHSARGTVSTIWGGGRKSRETHLWWIEAMYKNFSIVTVEPSSQHGSLGKYIQNLVASSVLDLMPDFLVRHQPWFFYGLLKFPDRDDHDAPRHYPQLVPLSDML
jgi:hypothetical protein